MELIKTLFKIIYLFNNQDETYFYNINVSLDYFIVCKNKLNVNYLAYHYE